MPTRLERGLVLGGQVIPGTEDHVVRAPDVAWFEPGSRGTRPRARSGVDLLISHWTGGADHIDEAGEGGDLIDDAGITVFRNMRARKRTDGSPMDVGAEIVIAACAPNARRAEIWQLADPLKTACVGVSTDWNPRGINIERCMPGTQAQARRLKIFNRLALERRIAGANVEMVDFHQGEVTAFVWLCEILARHLNIPRTVPVDAQGRIWRQRFTKPQGKRATGAVEHYLSPSTTKYDTGSLALEQLQAAGWAGKRVA